MRTKKEHVAVMRPIAVDLFAGVGGLSLGLEQAGFDVVAAVEIDPIHAAAHKFNFPNTAVLARSVSDVTGDDIRRMSGIGRRKVDVVCGGAPCQGFSLIGQRQIDDPRNRLVREFLRIVKELEADYFIFENVKGLTLGPHKVFLEELIGSFEKLGYKIKQPWSILNAADFGVPQDRERLFLLGCREGLSLPEYPTPQFARPGTSSARLPVGPTCWDALADLPDAELFDELLDGDAVRTFIWGKPSEYARRLRDLATDGENLSHPRIWDRTVLTASARTQHSAISRRRFAETIEGSVEPISRFLKLSKTGVSNTLRAGTDAARGAFTSPRPIHFDYPRCVTVREMARLHGFPDWFRFHETKWHGARQIGNSVPPPLGRAVGRQIIAAMNVRIQRPATPIRLGSENLVRLSMSEAATLFGVARAVSRRDRKSGAKKRKQEEIEAERLLNTKARAYG